MFSSMIFTCDGWLERQRLRLSSPDDLAVFRSVLVPPVRTAVLAVQLKIFIINRKYFKKDNNISDSLLLLY